METYIIHVRKPSGVSKFASPAKRLEWHRSFLPPTANSTSDCEKPQMIYSYDAAISGFAAKLTREQLKVVKGMEGFLHAHREQVLSVQTTYTPQFVGLLPAQGLWQRAALGRGVIIGVLDSGIQPDRASFQDNGQLPPPPAGRWRGQCNFSDPRFCNNKLIGAVSLLAGDAVDTSPFDVSGHGTHVAGTVLGMFANGAQLLGMATGMEAGTAPYAHLAVYKVCGNSSFCGDCEILAGIDQAIYDGVDVISMSLGRRAGAWPFHEVPSVVGSLAAVEQGIFVSCSAGNDGPRHVTVGNDAPWMLTVGASTTDRAPRATLRLANGRAIEGETFYQPTGNIDPNQPYLLEYPGASGIPAREFCDVGSLDGMDLRHRIVMCASGGGIAPFVKGEVVKKAGGVGMVLMNQESDGFTIQVPLIDHPAIGVTYADAEVLRQYVASHVFPVAVFEFGGATFCNPNTPAVASFSSRGPSWANDGGVLKPDVIGAGVNIVASWSSLIGPDPYYFESGTSMATTHLTAVAALLKFVHSDWSPAAIRSAIMTTSYVVNRDRRPIVDQAAGNPADVFAMGAGHVDPERAVDPGLVYDLDPRDYLSYLCTLGYTQQQLQMFAQRPVDCSNPVTADNLNYPSLSTVMGSRQQRVLTRTLTNVGEDNSVYNVRVAEPLGVTVTVVPQTLVFRQTGQKLSFTVTVTTREAPSAFSSGRLTWVSANHLVASPIAVLFRDFRPTANGFLSSSTQT